MSLRRSIERLAPYPSLFLLAVPTATVEPLKLAAVALAGKGHWTTGAAMIAVCYAFSLLLVEKLFIIVKPKVLQIPWFARLWNGFVSIRTAAWTRLKRCVGLRLAPSARLSRAPDRRKLPNHPPIRR
ncbi:hypothetical protein IC762_30390 [Bradyrhizobium genosp. L]|uniref:hypothetical protein n=1 Tax=Bradyrhizobium genosp. L TaxID=83637 RepID=UPI0018A25FA7|nr:hypothetical protein [Bradyrhizobium genosp. L]QPF83923.1 hypothetical protein IC762_30390 [Bradyrhizobium genosp. L]